MKHDLVGITELTDTELDAVAAGHGPLVNVSDIEVVVSDNHVLENFLNNSLNDIQVPVGIAVAVLGRADAFALARR